MFSVLYLLAVHTLADFHLQTNWMAVNKSKNNKALLAHVGVYALAMLVATWSVPFALITFVAHFATDWATSRITRRQWPFQPVQQAAGGRGLEGNLLLDAEGTLSSVPIYLPAGLGAPYPLYLKRSRHGFFCTIGDDQLLHFTQLILTAWWLGWTL